MIGAAFSALFYGVTPVCANRSIRLLGFLRANLLRLLIALAVMAALAFTLGQGFGDQYRLFAVAGAVGFGVGGLAMFRALPWLGAPLASLIVETVSAFVGAIVAWIWFSDKLTGKEIIFCLYILTGGVVGLLPYVLTGRRGPAAGLPAAGRRAGRLVIAGSAVALIAAIAQGISSVISRRGMLALQKSVKPVPGHPKVKVGTSFEFVSTAAFDRLIGGFLVALLVIVLAVVLGKWAVQRGSWPRWTVAQAQPTLPAPAAAAGIGPASPARAEGTGPLADKVWLWVGSNALFGPILGVTCMVWALQTMQPGKAQAVAAIAPLIAVPFARWLEGHRPPPVYYAGALIAVAGAVGLALSGG